MLYIYLYLAVAILLLGFACWRRDGAENYSVFCHTLGLCLLWPTTIALEAAGRRWGG